MEKGLLIKNYIQLISEDGFINEDSNIFFKNIGTHIQEVFYDCPNERCIKQIKFDYIEGNNVTLKAEINYSSLQNFQNAEVLKNYIDDLIKTRKSVFTKELICMDAIEKLKHLIESHGYKTEDVYYNFPNKRGQSFSFIEFPSDVKFSFQHIEQTDFITITETVAEISKKIIFKSDEMTKLNDENIFDVVKQKLIDKN